MIELEKLYQCAGTWLDQKPHNWRAFTDEFALKTNARFALYQPQLEGENLALRCIDKVISTTNPEYTKSYIEERIFDSNVLSDDSLNPFEPARRSDLISDEEYRNSDAWKNFGAPRGIFYLLAVTAVLKDDSYLMLVIWRNQNQKDFSNIEKLRMALFMRYLSTLVPVENETFSLRPDGSVDEFGKKYGLTESEVEVLGALLQGKSLKMIAKESKRAYKTIRWHVQNILEKCRVKSQKNLLSEFYRLIKR